MTRLLVNANTNPEFRSLEGWFSRAFGEPTSRSTEAPSLPVDVSEVDGKLTVRAAVPGIDPAHLNISIESNVLTISGEHTQPTESPDAKVFRRELAYGNFTRSLRLPQNLDLNAVDAEFKNGIVTVTIPRIVEPAPTVLKVPVRSGDPGNG